MCIYICILYKVIYRIYKYIYKQDVYMCYTHAAWVDTDIAIEDVDTRIETHVRIQV